MCFSSVLVRDLALGKATAGQGGFLLWVLSYWEEMELTTRIHLLYHCQNMHGCVLDDWMVEHYGNDLYTCGKSQIHIFHDEGSKNYFVLYSISSRVAYFFKTSIFLSTLDESKPQLVFTGHAITDIQTELSVAKLPLKVLKCICQALPVRLRPDPTICS